MGGTLPDYIDPMRLAEAHARLVGQLPLSSMPRLCTSLYSDEGRVVAELQFGIDEQGVHYIDGRITTQLQALCQRCMESLPMAVETDIHLGVVSSEAEANRLIGSYEPLVIHAEPMRLAQLLEDELILSMPMTPKHPAGTCKAFSDEPEAPPQRHANPFAVLAKLRTKDS